MYSVHTTETTVHAVSRNLKPRHSSFIALTVNNNNTNSVEIGGSVWAEGFGI